MDEKKGAIITFFLSVIFLVIIISILFYFAYDFYLLNKEENSFIVEQENVSLVDTNIIESYPNGILFYPKMRFISPNISYSIDINCSQEKINDANEAFKILDNETILNFKRTLNGDILVRCSDEEIFTDSEHFIAGEGGPTYLINSGEYVIIYNGTIQLYQENDCDSPLVAIHEILHVLGFTHSLNKASIMYNYSRCDQKITKEIINKITEMYSDPILPDLTIENISATKSGRYLDFELIVLNVGLAEAKNVNLNIYDENQKEVGSYNLENLEIGEGKILKLTNLKTTFSLSKLTFVIDKDNLIEEISEKNNQKILGMRLS